ncbi:MAG: TonB-dependent receptor [Cytophagales bacterium]|nr:TonB-dependent receptor [Cytophaga sp.]
MNFFRISFICIFFLLQTGYGYAQQARIKGTVADATGTTFPGVYIILNDTVIIAATDSDGKYESFIPCCKPVSVKIKYLGYSESPIIVNAAAGEIIMHNFVPSEEALKSKEITIVDYKVRDTITYNAVDINTIASKYVPSAFGDFTKSLTSMGLGVSSNSELSTQYSVRGGNYDENLVYINDIQIYKPQLAQAGQQQGLSAINPDLIRKVSFSPGAWEAKYGDKLSSVLTADYKVPTRYAGSITAGLLGGAVHVEGITLNKRMSFVSGARLKSSKYLLNTLDTKGEYKPVFWDWQTVLTFDITSGKRIKQRPGLTKLDVIFLVSQNKYEIVPTTRQSTFGTLADPLRFDVAFDGRDIMTYYTIQGGARITRKVSNRFKTAVGIDAYDASEREYYDIEAGYKISSVDPDPNSPSYNQSVAIKGIGSYFDHGRNLFAAWVANLNNRNVYYFSSRSTFEFGGSIQYEKIKDYYEEYNFSDSVGYVNMNRSVFSTTLLQSNRIQGYGQYIYSVDSTHVLISGVRLNYWSLNQQLLVSPRFQYVYHPRHNRNITLRLGTGIYQQPAFYREMRALDGSVNKDLKAQRSFHFIAGIDRTFKRWGRTFTFITEGYVKYMDRIVPYDLYDVRIRYYGINDGTAYATGIDFRLNGEFVKGVESWFNLGILSTKENIEGDNRGYIRRPTDQRVTAAIFFQDHLPNNPTIKVYMNLVFGTGLPFGPPNQPQYRSTLNAPAYRRVDIGFSKLISFNDKNHAKEKFLESIWISAEILNLLGTANTISYLWVPDYNNNYYAIPNTLTARFLNIKTIVRF